MYSSMRFERLPIDDGIVPLRRLLLRFLIPDGPKIQEKRSKKSLRDKRESITNTGDWSGCQSLVVSVH